MTKAQALALVGALEARKIPCDCLLRYDAGGTEVWSVQLDTSIPYVGADILTLANYCANQGLSLTATFQQLGVV